MQRHSSKTSKTISTPSLVVSKKAASFATFPLHDNRKEGVFQRKIQNIVGAYPEGEYIKQSLGTPSEVSPMVLQKVALEEGDLLQRKFKLTQLADFEKEEIQRKFATELPLHKKETTPNTTGLPDTLKSGVEQLSGHSMDDVKVHYNSNNPAQLNAHAYAQGTDIHLAAGQEKHLPHEAWHVVQQKQGRVRPTIQLKGRIAVNDDKGLEREADVMGARAIQRRKSVDFIKPLTPKTKATKVDMPIQRLTVDNTDWNQAQNITLTTGSGKGVAIISGEGPAIVVKAGEELGAEVIAATNLMKQVMEIQNSEVVGSDYRGQAVSARALQQNEIQAVVGKVNLLVQPDSAEKAKFILDLGNYTSVVYSYAPGEDMDEFLGRDKVTEKSGIKSRKGRQNSAVAQSWMDPGQLTLLGRASAVDVLTGNGDRMLSLFNPKNYRIDPTSKLLILIDNIQYGGESALKDTDFGGGNVLTANDSFNSWIQRPFVKDVLAHQFVKIATAVVDNMTSDFIQNSRQEDQPTMQTKFNFHKEAMIGWFTTGMVDGMEAVKMAMKNPASIVNGVPDAHKEQVKLYMVMRAKALEYGAVDIFNARTLAKAELNIL